MSLPFFIPCRRACLHAMVFKGHIISCNVKLQDCVKVLNKKTIVSTKKLLPSGKHQEKVARKGMAKNKTASSKKEATVDNTRMESDSDSDSDYCPISERLTQRKHSPVAVVDNVSDADVESVGGEGKSVPNDEQEFEINGDAMDCKGDENALVVNRKANVKQVGSDNEVESDDDEKIQVQQKSVQKPKRKRVSQATGSNKGKGKAVSSSDEGGSEESDGVDRKRGGGGGGGSSYSDAKATTFDNEMESEDEEDVRHVKKIKRAGKSGAGRGGGGGCSSADAKAVRVDEDTENGNAIMKRAVSFHADEKTSNNNNVVLGLPIHRTTRTMENVFPLESESEISETELELEVD